ncbi:LPXTG cell wall anchor domain-containing protein, partial [Streptomyces sp. TRM76130]|nr:LPXTG cell wall anchor domain-containing protein [Streptomyces sp. TRM76130]
RLADTGSFDSTPYVIGGTACLGLGAGFVVYSARRERLDFS